GIRKAHCYCEANGSRSGWAVGWKMKFCPQVKRCAVIGRKSSAPKKSFRPNALHNDNSTPEYRSSTAPHTGHVLPLRFGNQRNAGKRRCCPTMRKHLSEGKSLTFVA